MRQVIEVGETTATALTIPFGPRGLTGLLGLVFSLVSFGLRLSEARLELFQRQRQLLVVDFLRLATEVSAPDFGQDRLKALIARLQSVMLGADRIALAHGGIALTDGGITLGDNGGMVSKRGIELRAQRVDVVRKSVGTRHHGARRH